MALLLFLHINYAMSSKKNIFPPFHFKIQYENSFRMEPMAKIQPAEASDIIYEILRKNLEGEL